MMGLRIGIFGSRGFSGYPVNDNYRNEQKTPVFWQPGTHLSFGICAFQVLLIHLPASPRGIARITSDIYGHDE